MATVTAGSTGSYTFTEALNTIQVSLDSNERAHVTVLSSSGALLYKDNIQTSRTIGPFDVGDVMSLTAIGGSVVYTPSYSSAGVKSIHSDDSTGAIDTASAVALAESGTLAIGTYSTLALLAAVSPSSYPTGVRALVGPDSNGQYSEWYSNGVRWRPRSGIIAMKNTAGSVTDAGTSEQDVYSVVIPASLIGPNDDWYVDHFWQWPNSATNKVVRVKFGGTTIASLTATTTVTGRGTTHIYMRDSKTAQIFSAASSALGFQEGQTSGTVPTTATIDTNSDITINLTGQWGTAGAGSNLITLERVAVGIKFAY